MLPNTTEGLTPIDEVRALSMADEGGASGASVESQHEARPQGRRSRFASGLAIGAAAFLIGLVVVAWGRRAPA